MSESISQVKVGQLTIVFCLLCAALAYHSATAQESSGQTPDSFQLEFQKIFGSSRQIELTAAEYLANLVAGETNDAEFLKHIARLGSENYQERQNAEAFLFTVPVLPEKYRLEVDGNPDMEVRYRLKSIFAHRKNRVEALTVAALKTIGEKKQRQAMATVFKLLNSTTSASAKRAAKKTIREVADESHAEILLAQLKAESAETRLLAANLYAELGLDRPVESLSPLTRDPDEYVRLEVSKLLVDLKHRPAVSVLIAMLKSEKLSMASRAERVLRAVTDQDFGKISYSDKENNQRIADAWKKWETTNLQTAKLNLPLKDFLQASARLNGHTLIAKDQSQIIELDENNNEVFKMDVKGVLSAEKTIDGNYLLFSYSGQWLREYSPEKKVNWEITGIKFNNAMPLNNGNALVSIGPSSLVREINPQTKETVWEYKTSWWPNDAFRLENGNTLIGGKGGVIEVSPEKKIVWEYKNPDASTIVVVAKPTENDGVLVGWTNGMAKVIDREKKTVWEYKAAKLSDVFRDSNGNTLVATTNEIIELDPDKKIIWRTKKQAKTASVRR